jgi:hypothetical protein
LSNSRMARWLLRNAPRARHLPLVFLLVGSRMHDLVEDVGPADIVRLQGELNVILIKVRKSTDLKLIKFKA